MKHTMKLNSILFRKILNSKKDIELRLYDQKRQMIRVGDILNSKMESFYSREQIENFGVIGIVFELL